MASSRREMWHRSFATIKVVDQHSEADIQLLFHSCPFDLGRAGSSVANSIRDAACLCYVHYCLKTSLYRLFFILYSLPTSFTCYLLLNKQVLCGRSRLFCRQKHIPNLSYLLPDRRASCSSVIIFWHKSARPGPNQTDRAGGY